MGIIERLKTMWRSWFAKKETDPDPVFIDYGDGVHIRNDFNITMRDLNERDEVRVIGFCGHAGAGKDTARDIMARLLREKCGLIQGVDFEKAHMAEALKRASAVFFTENQLDNPALKETIDDRYNITPRKFQQEFGSFLRNTLGIDCFINYTKGRMEDKLLLLTGIRMHEGEFAHQHGINIMIKMIDQKLTEVHQHETDAPIPLEFVDIIIAVPRGVHHVEAAMARCLLAIHSFLPTPEISQEK